MSILHMRALSLVAQMQKAGNKARLERVRVGSTCGRQKPTEAEL